MFDDLMVKLWHVLTSRMTILSIVFIILGCILGYRCFDLQIVNGEEYLDEYMLMVEKSRDIAATRGNIFDRNGKLLAYNELAYSVKIEDTFESGRGKNSKLNDVIYRLIKIIESNDDAVITDFKIVIDEDGKFAYNVSGTRLLRFIADIYGKSSISDLKEEQKNATPMDIMKYLSGTSMFAIGEYEDPEDTKSTFVPGRGYTQEEWLKMVTIRYAMHLTSYRKYIGTTVATNVCEKTVAVIMENSTQLPGVTIVEDTIRKYEDSVYFSQLLGYIGNVSSDEMSELNGALGEGDTPYTINDIVGKSGLESYLETTLRGTKGYEKVIVDITGKVITTLEYQEPQAGKDVYLTIDKDLTIAIYNILEQKLAGLVASKIINSKEYKQAEDSTSGDIKIPIYDVYFALINNNVIDIKKFNSENPGEYESKLYEQYELYKSNVYDTLRTELFEKKTPYNRLSKEYQVYQSNLITLFKKNGVLNAALIDSSDKIQNAWAVEETISMAEYLQHCIAMNWIDVSMLELDSQYSDSAEIFQKLVDLMIVYAEENTEFQKRFYKYMLLNDKISGKDVALVLCEQEAVNIPIQEEEALRNNRLTAFQFMMNRIEQLDITPAQLALDPCNASCVVTDVNNGDTLAIVTYPGYDNNKMANSVDAEYYAKLNVDKSNPQYNFATQYKGAPGSTFKMVMASLGLMENTISLQSKINCTGTFESITPSPRCWRIWGHGNEDVVTAIRDSCNYFFYDLGYKISLQNGIYDEEAGLNLIYKYADMFGLTDKSGIEINEAEPEVSTSDPVRSAIGQGNHSFTTVGLARYITTIANSGTCYNLTLIDQITDSDGNVLEINRATVRNTVDMPESYWNAIQSGMRKVVEGKVYFSDLAVHVAGKTGTAQQTKSRPNHALFVGYAPYESPEIGIATRIPFGYSSDYAAQATREVIKYYYGLAEEEDIITGTADEITNVGITNEF